MEVQHISHQLVGNSSYDIFLAESFSKSRRLLVQKTPTRVGHWFYKIAFNKSKNRFCCTVPCKRFFEILYQDFVFYIKGRVWMESFFSLSILLVSKIYPLFCMEFIRKRRNFWWRDSTSYFDLNNLPKKFCRTEVLKNWILWR